MLTLPEHQRHSEKKLVFRLNSSSRLIQCSEVQCELQSNWWCALVVCRILMVTQKQPLSVLPKNPSRRTLCHQTPTGHTFLSGCRIEDRELQGLRPVVLLLETSQKNLSFLTARNEKKPLSKRFHSSTTLLFLCFLAGFSGEKIEA